MKKWMASLILVVFLFPCGGFAGEKGLKPQTVCPVLGGKINKDVYTDYQGQRIYSALKTWSSGPGQREKALP